MKRQFTNEQLADCAKREARMRRNVYAGRVSKGAMSQSEAGRQIAMMEEIQAVFESGSSDQLDLLDG